MIRRLQAAAPASMSCSMGKREKEKMEGKYGKFVQNSYFCGMKKAIFNSVDAYNKFYGFHTIHPLVSVVDFKEAADHPYQAEINSDLYGLFLNISPSSSVKYGRREHDFQEGTIIAMSPGQSTFMDVAPEDDALDILGIVFHPDLIYGSSLAETIGQYHFFAYSELEALHVSDMEREKFRQYYDEIKRELNLPVDSHTAKVISTNIQLLLEHLQRFYDRQFSMRHKENYGMIQAFEEELRKYFSADVVPAIPHVAYFADKFCLSVGYFSDIIKRETGYSPKELIDIHVIAEAKRRLASLKVGVSEVAYSLGFEYPAHFTRLFKRHEGITPTEFRMKFT